VHFHDVVVFEGFEDFCLHENIINISSRTEFIGSDNFDGKPFACLFVFGEMDLPKTSFS
jgi:hypothetical protein